MRDWAAPCDPELLVVWGHRRQGSHQQCLFQVFDPPGLESCFRNEKPREPQGSAHPLVRMWLGRIFLRFLISDSFDPKEVPAAPGLNSPVAWEAPGAPLLAHPARTIPAQPHRPLAEPWGGG